MNAAGAVESHPTRLGLVLDQVLYERDGRYSTDEAFIRFIEQAFRALFDRIQFCSRAGPAQHDGPYLLDPSIYDIIALPWYDDMTSLCLKAPVLLPRIGRVLDRAMRGWEIVIVGNVNPLAPLALRMARRRQLPSILWVRGNLHADLEHRLGGPVRRLVGKLAASAVVRAIPRGTHVISSGENDHPFLSRMGPAQVVYSSKFGDDDFVSLPRSHPGERRPRLLYVGRIAPEKGLEILLEALRILVRRRAGLASPLLTLVGSDFIGSTYGDDFRRRLEGSDLADCVQMVGYVPYGERLFGIYDEHDIMVLPSFTEGFPQVLLEAMIRGLPVVSTAVGGIPKVIRDGENGLLTPSGDAEALASALNRVLADPELVDRLSREGQRVARSYTREAQTRAIEKFIRQSFPRIRLKTAC